MSIPPNDLAALLERGTIYNITIESNMTCIVFPRYQLPVGYDRDQSDLLIRLSPGYPDVPPDMWWFDPPIRLANGRMVQATEVTEHHLGRPWQRWSRHFNEGQWRSGVDCLESFIALIRRELECCVTESVR